MTITIYSTEKENFNKIDYSFRNKLLTYSIGENGKYHLIYMIVNNKNNMIYIGKHSTKNPYDDYMGSGDDIKTAIVEYGIENFSKYILYCLPTEYEAYIKEAEIVTWKFVHRKDTYNKIPGGKGAKSGENHIMFGKSSPMKGKHFSEEAKRKMSIKQLGEKGHNAKIVQKLDLEGNIVAEYGCKKECAKKESVSRITIRRRIKSRKIYKGFYYKFKE